LGAVGVFISGGMVGEIVQALIDVRRKKARNK
jgi:hypothetical protein